MNDLISNGQEELALEVAPRTRGGQSGDRGRLIYHRGPDGLLFLGEDAEGHRWLPDYPVLTIDWFGARAYAAWEAARTGRPWRLPGELEREKASRGVDGRSYPWGDFMDPSLCCVLESRGAQKLPARVGDFPHDLSPYGVRGSTGNSRDWCLDGERGSGPFVVNDRYTLEIGTDDAWPTRVARGGSWVSPSTMVGAARRFPCAPLTRRESIGVRLARSWPPLRSGA